MSDIGIFLQADDTYDVQIAKADLETDEGLRTAVVLSLFVDGRAEEDELAVLPEESSRRGWWGDQFPEIAGDKIGSKLWLLKREKRSVETLNRAEEYSKEALQWMIDDGVAETLDVSAEYNSDGVMLLTILITKPGGSGTFRFQGQWATEDAR